MPIKKWHGWGAWCTACQHWVDLGDGNYAWEQREQVKDSLTDSDKDCRTWEAQITDCCGCQRRLDA